MAWRVARSLEVLLRQINELAPHRDKSSDGSIGDAAHASRSSDHNPWVIDGGVGVVTARDFSHDPHGGFDSYAFAEMLRLNRDIRIKYVISNHRIFSSETQPWKWRPYSGSNPHDHHVHVSVLPEKTLYDSELPWRIGAMPSVDPSTPAPTREPVLKRGSAGSDVIRLQTLLGITSDGIFGPATEAAVRQRQSKAGIVSDGIAGPQTWNEIKTHPILPGRKVLFQAAGKMSTFGGPHDTGVTPTEGLALFSSDVQMIGHGLGVFLLSEQQAGAPGLARRLNPLKPYLACRWNVADYPKLRDAVAHVSAKGKTVEARPVDWGPNINTGRAADLSPGLATELGIETDDECTVIVYEDGK